MVKNSRGFTLVELIISMSILSTVFFIGHKVVNGTNTSIKNQQVIASGQSSINIINKYLTKDLENIPNDKNNGINKVVESEDDKSLRYYYSIKTNGVQESVDKSGNPIIIKVIKYEVEVNKEKNFYSVNRKTYSEESDSLHKNDINIIVNQQLKYQSEEIPFEITKNDAVYTVKTIYTEGDTKSIDNYKNKEYKFDVRSRIELVSVNDEDSEMSTRPPELEELPNTELKSYGSLGFWASNYEKPTTDGKNLYMWSDKKGSGQVDKFGDNRFNVTNTHSIYAFLNPGDSGNKSENEIDMSNMSESKYQSPKVEVSKIIVYLVDDAELSDFSIKIERNGNDKNLQEMNSDNEEWESISEKIRKKIYTIPNGNKVIGIEISGKLEITGNSGYVYIVYGN